MSFDALTVVAILVIVVVVTTVVVLNRRFNRDVERRLRNLATQTHYLMDNPEARELCGIIRQQHPDACAGIDFTIEEATDGSGPRIGTWNLPAPRPRVGAHEKGG